jgi:heme exporter protein CcmD
MSSFMQMGGYAAFVWPAYAISIAGLVLMVWTTWRAYARAKAKLVPDKKS